MILNWILDLNDFVTKTIIPQKIDDLSGELTDFVGRSRLCRPKAEGNLSNSFYQEWRDTQIYNK
ncbi:MAG TPA: hypothetical protein DD745_16600, partial [Bacteroidales bacterium]|nr:hypothetical protein [Bacteroidales bacterium]HBQ83025.1 hypothetical protein [Bacteroidales bacterium]HBQ83791.1 hypothetical protein [Bacteroidales bacterium]HBQ84472.1 hypothetical protein [Bacteroidales bacterium]